MALSCHFSMALARGKVTRKRLTGADGWFGEHGVQNVQWHGYPVTFRWHWHGEKLPEKGSRGAMAGSGNMVFKMCSGIGRNES